MNLIHRHSRFTGGFFASTVAGIALLGGVAFGQISIPSITNFGSTGDGLGGFVATTSDDNQSWLEETNSQTMTLVSESGLHNSSLLNQAILDRSEGSSYIFTGVMTWDSGYADDNNRTGLILFAEGSEVVTEEEGLSLQWNIDTGSNVVAIRPGVNGDLPLDARATKLGIFGSEVFGKTFTYQGTVIFTATNIDVEFTLSDPDGTETTVSTSVLAADYPGEYFGFASRNRCRNLDDNDQVLKFESFTVASLAEDPDSVLTSFNSLGGGVWEVVLQAAPETSYELRSSTTLSFVPGDFVESLTQEAGAPGSIEGVNQNLITTDASGNDRVRMSFVGIPANFVRAEKTP